MVVVDPRRTETARVADEHVFVRPGTDAVVLLAMIHVLFAEGLTRPASYVDGVERVREAVADFSPEHAEGVSGVPAETVRRLTRELAAADGGVAYGRVGLSTQGFGTVCQWAVACLNVLTGNLDREGGALFTEPAIDFVTTRLIGRGHHDLYRSRVRDAPEYGGELPGVGVRRGDRDTGRGTGPCGAHDRRQPGAVDTGREAPRRRASRRSTSWRRSTSTSTRRPGTPT